LILEKEKWKNVLIINDEKYFEIIWSDFYWDLNEKIKESEIIKLPTYKITNELDKRILAELNNIWIEIENAMENYQLDIAAKSILGFIDRLNNRYIRRSRRRFRAPWMNEDKISAYNTLFKTLKNYVKLCAPFVPFISEHIYLQLLNFKWWNVENNKSVHLLHLPLFSKKYINQNLLEEIWFVRRIISLWLFIRSKNNIKTKQPLQKMEVKI
jgi:isoleucyl-tRNA synthetase